MESISLKDTLRAIYEDYVFFIRGNNINLERKYFTENSDHIPMSDIMQGVSYEDHFENFKRIVKNGNEGEIEQIFMLLQEYFLFSFGHDMLFKKKLEAESFTSVPLEELIYPMLEAAVEKKYTDISVFKENPHYNDNIAGIDKLTFTYIELQSLLYLLYCYDFQFPNGWEALFPDDHEEIIAILRSSGMTIGNFLHALIDFKCKIMREIFSKINNPERRKFYLEKVEALKEAKHEETKGFNHVSLPVTYFLDHSLGDFIQMNSNSSLFGDTAPESPSSDGPSLI